MKSMESFIVGLGTVQTLKAHYYDTSTSTWVALIVRKGVVDAGVWKMKVWSFKP
jgi:hypothetical protein